MSDDFCSECAAAFDYLKQPCHKCNRILFPEELWKQYCVEVERELAALRQELATLRSSVGGSKRQP